MEQTTAKKAGGGAVLSLLFVIAVLLIPRWLGEDPFGSKSRQSNRGTTVSETEYFPVWFVSSLAIRQYGGVLRLSRQKNLLVSDRRFSANRADERRGTRPRHA